jgi:recombination protein RecT
MSGQAIQKAQPGAVDKMLAVIMQDIASRQAKLEDLLPPDMTPARFTASVGLALAQQPALLKCDRGSIVLSVMKAAKLGIDVAGGALGHGALVPFGTECTFVPMYKGLVMLAVTSGVVKDVTPVLVYEKDHFALTEGDTPHVEHRPYVPRKATDGRGDIIAAYTRITLPDGTRVIKGMLYADDIARVEASTKGRNTPWSSPHRPEMVKKSTLKNAFKTLGVPAGEQAARLREALAADIEAEARGVDEHATHTLMPEPTSGVAGLKAALKAKKTPPLEEAQVELVSHNLANPNAEPPDDMRLPGQEG